MVPVDRGLVSAYNNPLLGKSIVSVGNACVLADSATAGAACWIAIFLISWSDNLSCPG